MGLKVLPSRLGKPTTISRSAKKPSFQGAGCLALNNIRFGTVFDDKTKISKPATSQINLNWDPKTACAVNKAAEEALDEALVSKPTPDGERFETFRNQFVESFLTYAQSHPMFITELQAAGLTAQHITNLKKNGKSLSLLTTKSVKDWEEPGFGVAHRLHPALKNHIVKAQQDFLAATTAYTQLLGYENIASLSDALAGLLLSPVFGETTIQVFRKKTGLDQKQFEEFRHKFFSTVGYQTSEPPKAPPKPKTSTSTALVPQKPTIDCIGDLTSSAKSGKIKPIYGREAEIAKLGRLIRGGLNASIVMVGPKKVGKTAIVRGLAQQIADKKVAPDLQKMEVWQLDAERLKAESKDNLDFRNKFVYLVRDAFRRANVILHLQNAPLLKYYGVISGFETLVTLFPEGSRSKLVLDLSPTDYKKFIEKDDSIDKGQYDLMHVNPTTPETTLKILEDYQLEYEIFHKVKYEPEALKDMVQLSDRYIRNTPFPNKGFAVMDRAAVMAREKASPTVTRDHVAQAVGDLTGIPAGSIAESERQKLLRLEDTLRERVLGQDEAIKEVAKIIRRKRSGLELSQGPIGTFLFLGPSGVGKTELGKALSEWMTGSEDNLIRIDMSEYMEKHTVSRLIGAPPGYVGFDQGGQLTSAIQKKPYSVILLDEFEKAHPDVQHVLLQLLDEGRLTDGQGNTVDARNSIIILTSNAGSASANSLRDKSAFGFTANKSEHEQEADMIRESQTEAVHAAFRPEFLNRLDDIIHFNPLSPDIQKDIVRLHLGKFLKKLHRSKQIIMVMSDDAVSFLANRLFSKKESEGHRQGGRKVLDLIERYLSDPLSDAYLRGEVQDGMRVNVTLDPEKKALVFAPDVPPSP